MRVLPAASKKTNGQSKYIVTDQFVIILFYELVCPVSSVLFRIFRIRNRGDPISSSTSAGRVPSFTLDQRQDQKTRLFVRAKSLTRISLSDR